MKAPEIPANETRRLETLQATNLLDSMAEERFDRLTRMAKRIFSVPIALVSLIDENRQWFKSNQGLAACETPRDVSFCGHAILDDDVFIIPDTHNDERFKDNPLVTDSPNIRFYAGCPLKVANGSRLGTLCIIDSEPRNMDADELELLRDLATMVEQEINALQLATLDELTLISNRRGFKALAEHSLKVCQRNALPVAILLFDLDNFKPVNDKFGHAEGDRALVTFADVMQQVFRDSDVFARVGGDEFAALLTDADQNEVETILTRFQQAIEQHNSEGARGYNLEYSVGCVYCDANELKPISELLALADQQMYLQKNRSN